MIGYDTKYKTVPHLPPSLAGRLGKYFHLVRACVSPGVRPSFSHILRHWSFIEVYARWHCPPLPFRPNALPARLGSGAAPAAAVVPAVVSVAAPAVHPAAGLGVAPATSALLPPPRLPASLPPATAPTPPADPTQPGHLPSSLLSTPYFARALAPHAAMHASRGEPPPHAAQFLSAQFAANAGMPLRELGGMAGAEAHEPRLERAHALGTTVPLSASHYPAWLHFAPPPAPAAGPACGSGDAALSSGGVPAARVPTPCMVPAPGHALHFGLALQRVPVREGTAHARGQPPLGPVGLHGRMPPTPVGDPMLHGPHVLRVPGTHPVSQDGQLPVDGPHHVALLARSFMPPPPPPLSAMCCEPGLPRQAWLRPPAMAETAAPYLTSASFLDVQTGLAEWHGYVPAARHAAVAHPAHAAMDLPDPEGVPEPPLKRMAVARMQHARAPS